MVETDDDVFLREKVVVRLDQVVVVVFDDLCRSKQDVCLDTHDVVLVADDLSLENQVV